MNNRRHNVTNPYQGNYKRVLCVCSAGLLRSPTAAVVLSQEPFNFNTRAAGLVKEYALVPVDPILLHWADEVVVMESWMGQEIEAMGFDGDIKCLNIPDNYEYRDPELVELIKEQYVKGV